VAAPASANMPAIRACAKPDMNRKDTYQPKDAREVLSYATHHDQRSGADDKPNLRSSDATPDLGRRMKNAFECDTKKFDALSASLSSNWFKKLYRR